MTTGLSYTGGFGADSGPNYGFGIPQATLGAPRTSGVPPSYVDAYIPNAGVRFDLGSTSVSDGQGSSTKRPYLSGDFGSEMASWAMQPMGKRARRDTYRDIQGYTTALPNNLPFQGELAGDPARRFGFNLSMLNKHNLTTIGFLTNPTVPGNETYLKRIPNYETPGENDLVIMRNQLPGETPTWKFNQAEAFFVDTSKRTAYTLQGFNHYIASLQRQPSPLKTKLSLLMEQRQLEHIPEFGAFEQGNWASPAIIWRFFHIGGVVNSEVFADGTSSVTRHEYGLDQKNRTTRDVRVNMIKYGRAQVLGLAPPNKPVGTTIYLITKRVHRPRAFRVDTTRAMTAQDENFLRNLRIGNRNELDEAQEYPFQVIPWTSGKGKKMPSPDDLAYTDPHTGLTRYGSAKFLAVINKENHTDMDIDPYTLATDLALSRTQTPLDVFLTL